MSRGPGRTERGVLATLAGNPYASTGECAVAVYGPEPSESQQRATRRAIASLRAKGLAAEPSERASEARQNLERLGGRNPGRRQGYSAAVRRAVETLVEKGELFTSETVLWHVLDHEPQAYVGGCRGVVPAAIRAAQARGVIHPVYWTRAQRRSSRGRLIRAWVGVGQSSRTTSEK